MAGGIPVLIAAIGTAPEVEVSKSAAAIAMGVIHCLALKTALPADLVDEAEDLLLRLQAVPRLTTFLRSITFDPVPGSSAPNPEGGNMGINFFLPFCMRFVKLNKMAYCMAYWCNCCFPKGPPSLCYKLLSVRM